MERRIRLIMSVSYVQITCRGNRASHIYHEEIRYISSSGYTGKCPLCNALKQCVKLTMEIDGLRRELKQVSKDNVTLNRGN